jgi:hypothetical protein
MAAKAALDEERPNVLLEEISPIGLSAARQSYQHKQCDCDMNTH